VANAYPKARGKRKNRGSSGIAGPGGEFSSGRGALGLSGGGNRATSRRTQVIEEDEYIGEVSGSVGFATTAYALNPGQSGTFPWGSKIAALYEKYDFEAVEFYYKREVSEYASNGQTGKVILSFDYDASDGAPTTKQQVEDTVPHIDGMPCTPTIRLPLDCRCIRNSPARFVRPGAQPLNTDIKTYDAGNLYVSTQGCAGTTVIGELRVRYRCKFSEPVLESTGGSAGQAGSQFLITSNPAGETAAATTVQGLLFASVTTPVVVQNTIAATVASTGLITLPSGVYLIEGGNTGWNASAAVTGQVVQLVQSSTLTNYLEQGTGNSTSSGSTYAHATENSELNGFVLNTSTASSSVVGMSTALTYASGTGMNNAWLRITLLSVAPLSEPAPGLSSSSCSITDSLLLARLSRLEKLLEKDSEFEDDEASASPGKLSVAPSSSASTVSLSSSALGMIGELMARKSAPK